MKKLICLLVVGLSVFASVFAADATVTFVKGKVEVNRNNEWIALNVGDVVHQSEVVSTGFQSEAKLRYNGNYMTLSALTRASIEEMSTNGNEEKVSVALATGALRSKVTHPDNTRVDYKVRSPVAVASVRGTDFVSVACGTTYCYEGIVQVVAARNQLPIVSSNNQESEEEEQVAEEDELPGDYEGNNDSEAPSPEKDEGSEPDSEAPDNKPAAGTIVITRNQRTEFNTNGNPEKPIDTASKQITSGSKAIQTAAETEAVVAGGSTTALGGPSKSADVANLIITIDFE